MVSNIQSIYPAYRGNTQYDRQNHGAAADRPVFGKVPDSIDPALSRDISEVKKVKEGFNCISNQVDRLDKKALKTTEATLLTSGLVIPTCRRLNSVPKDLEDSNWQRPAMLAGVAALSLPGDLREMMFAGKDIGNIYRSGGTLSSLAENAAKNKFQHGLSLFKGTFLDPLTDKFKWLRNMDKTLFDTDIGRFIRKTFNIQQYNNKRGEGFIFRTVGGRNVSAIRFKGGFAKELTGRALLRVPVLGFFLGAALEIPAIIKSARVEGSFTDKAKSVGKQLCKSAGFIGLVQGGMALAGAAAVMLFPPVGALAALIGMGLGSAAGVLASKELNKFIDDAFA